METDKFGICHCFNLRRAGNKVLAMYNEKIESCGLSGNQFTVLNYIGGYVPINISELSKLLYLDRTTLVRNLKPLENAGYIQYEKGTGRERLLTLTEKGKEKQEESQKLWEEAQSELEEKLGAENMAMFHEVIRAIYQM